MHKARPDSFSDNGYNTAGVKGCLFAMQMEKRLWISDESPLLPVFYLLVKAEEKMQIVWPLQRSTVQRKESASDVGKKKKKEKGL